jgi:hypothetical protein
MKLLVALVNKLLAVPVLQTIIDVALARNKLLCAELLWMAHRDQTARKAWFDSTKSHTVENLKHFIQIDLSNTRRMKQIISQFGWPGQSMVGERGCEAAWLLIQHADHDPPFQKQCFILLERAVENNDAPASLLAYLTDRIRVHEGKPQVYGTQLHANLKPFPIEDETHVDERRMKAGLQPLADYLSQIQTTLVNRPSPREQIMEMKQLLSELPHSPEYEAYVTQIKRLLDMMDNF